MVIQTKKYSQNDILHSVARLQMLSLKDVAIDFRVVITIAKFYAIHINPTGKL